MNKKIIAINIGSRNKHYAFYENGELKCVGTENFKNFIKDNTIDTENLTVGIRIVAPGKLFTEDKEIDEGYLEKLRESAEIAPLHTELVINEIEKIRKEIPNIKIFGISDSSFHNSIPNTAKTYAIPKKWREEYGIQRQGYHGLSLSSVVKKFYKEFGSIPEKTIVCHLGGGSSVTALKDGISIDTSMGFTPLEGLPMTERSGDLDPGIVAFIAEKLRAEGKNLIKFLGEECGLEAISEIEKGDIPELLEAEKNEKEEAKLALDIYTYKIRKYIGAMATVLGGCDLLVFTGTVGLRSHPIRERVVQNLEYLGLTLDKEKNEVTYEPENIKFLGLDQNERKIAVVPIDEMSEIADSASVFV